MTEKSTSQIGKPSNAPLQRRPKPTRRILVAEDEADIRRLNTEVLTCSGYQVDAAENGAIAWNNLQQKNYDLLITDNDMPKVSDVELLLKLHAARMALPVIMATGTLPKKEFSQHPWIQPAVTLLKPYTIDELLETVKVVLRATDSSREQIAPPNRQGQPLPNGLGP